MDRLADQQLDQFDKKQNTTMDQLPYPWPVHDTNKGEISEEIAALKRAVGERRQVGQQPSALVLWSVQCQSYNSPVVTLLSILVRRDIHGE